MDIFHIIIISILLTGLAAALYQNRKLSIKYRRRIKPNWEILDDRLINLGMVMISQKAETEKLSIKIEELREQINQLNKRQ